MARGQAAQVDALLRAGLALEVDPARVARVHAERARSQTSLCAFGGAGVFPFEYVYCE